MIRSPKTQPEFPGPRRWGLSWGVWFDNRHGEWWLLAQLALKKILKLLFQKIHQKKLKVKK